MLEKLQKALSENKTRLGLSVGGGIAFFLLFAYLERPHSIQRYLSVWALVVFVVMFSGIYAFLTAIYFGFAQKHEGWKRVTVVLAIISGIVSGYLAYDGYDFDIRDIIQIAMGFGMGVTIGVALVVGGRWLVVWVLDGFKKD
jgi:hypothetical protein